MAAAATARVTKIAKLRAGTRPASDPAGEYDRAILSEVFGGDFRALPVILAANAAELTQAFGASTALQGGHPAEAWRWLRRTATVRAPAARLSEAMLFAGIMGTGDERNLRVAQVPFDASGTWIGLHGALPKLPTTGMVALTAENVDFSAGVAGLVLR